MSPAKQSARLEKAAAAAQAAAFTPDSLRQLLSMAGSVESILILDLIRRAAELSRDVANLASAMQQDATEVDKL